MVKSDEPPKPGRPSRGKPGGMIGVSVTADERDAYEGAAKRAGLSLSEWIRSACAAFLKKARR